MTCDVSLIVQSGGKQSLIPLLSLHTEQRAMPRVRYLHTLCRGLCSVRRSDESYIVKSFVFFFCFLKVFFFFIRLNERIKSLPPNWPKLVAFFSRSFALLKVSVRRECLLVVFLAVCFTVYHLGLATTLNLMWGFAAT